MPACRPGEAGAGRAAPPAWCQLAGGMGRRGLGEGMRALRAEQGEARQVSQQGEGCCQQEHA